MNEPIMNEPIMNEPIMKQSPFMASHRIAVIPGDGIGNEVIGAGVRVLKTLGVPFDFVELPWSSAEFKRTGAYIPSGGLDVLRTCEAIYFGAVGALDVPDHISLWELRLAICQGFDQFANIRPTRILPGIESPLRGVNPRDLDWLIVRENTEGEYAGVGGRAHAKQDAEVALETAVFTRTGIARVMHYAFQAARERRKQLTVVTKSNAQRHGLVLWDEIATEVSKGYPDVHWDKMLVDAMTVRMVNKPASLDTIVATNLHADILSDLAAALAGSIGIAATGNIDPTRRYPSMFEPIHGSAFDIAGKGIANPIGAFWSAVLMLQHLGEASAADRLMRAIEAVTASGPRTPDLGGRARTDEVTEAVISAIRAT